LQPILTKQAITSYFNTLNTKQTTAYDVGNLGPGLGQEHECGGVKLVNVSRMI